MQMVSTNPSEGFEVLGAVTMSTRADVDSAVAHARKAQRSWSEVTLEQRCTAIRSFVDVSKARAGEIITLIAMETGRPVATLDGHVQAAFDYLEAYCRMAAEHLAPMETMRSTSEVHTVHREPWGVMAAICPWNYPFLNVVWQCGQALIAGNTVVYKNSEENPLFAELLVELFAASAIPDGVFTVVQGDGTVGSWLAESEVDMISFTGSSATGRELAQIAARRLVPFLAELGGSSPGIIFEDADLDVVLNTVYAARFLHSGQVCAAIKRLIVHDTKFEEVVERLRQMVESKRLGRAVDADTDLGPLVAERQVERIAGQVEDAVKRGAVLVTGGKRPDRLDGAYFQPTILTNVSREMRVWTEETFGPVLPIVSFSTEGEAIELANDTMYGLNAWVMTRDADRFRRIARQLQAGAVAQNAGSYDHPNSPFGGYKQSGMGRTHGGFGFHEVTQPKLISTSLVD